MTARRRWRRRRAGHPVVGVAAGATAGPARRVAAAFIRPRGRRRLGAGPRARRRRAARPGGRPAALTAANNARRDAAAAAAVPTVGAVAPVRVVARLAAVAALVPTPRGPGRGDRARAPPRGPRAGEGRVAAPRPPPRGARGAYDEWRRGMESDVRACVERIEEIGCASIEEARCSGRPFSGRACACFSPAAVLSTPVGLRSFVWCAFWNLHRRVAIDVALRSSLCQACAIVLSDGPAELAKRWIAKAGWWLHAPDRRHSDLHAIVSAALRRFPSPFSLDLRLASAHHHRAADLESKDQILAVFDGIFHTNLCEYYIPASKQHKLHQAAAAAEPAKAADPVS